MVDPYELCHMSVMEKQIFATQPVVKQLVQADSEKTTSKLRITGPLWGEPPASGGSPHKGLVLRKAFPRYTIVMSHLIQPF